MFSAFTKHYLFTAKIGLVIFREFFVCSQGLSNVMVIVKTLGAGFHQPVDGVHHLSLVG
jgi:hypothetical protein